jgi:integrase/recombinase XerD
MSELRLALEVYLTIRRALGFNLISAGGLLHSFVLFAENEGASFISTQLVLRWATQPKCQPAQWANRLGIVRRFARYRSSADPRTEIPPEGILPHSRHRKTPYLYRDDEIVRLIQAATELSSPMGLRATTYSTFFGLLSATGMRISEPIALDREDVDLTEGILTVRRTKFGKSRLVPVHSSTQEVLRQYASLRDRIFPRPKTPSFFISERGRRLTPGSARWTFIKLSHQIGLRGPDDHRGPRPHDLRHGFVIRTLLRLYRAGTDVERHLPTLATYLGHGHVADTYWYLSATPELLRLITSRLDAREQGRPS